MEYRRLGRSGFEISAISLGTEYLLHQESEAVARTLHAAIDRGVNYFDLFWPQPEFRDRCGAALRGSRSRVHLAAHLGAAMNGEQYEASRDVVHSERCFHDFLSRYKTDYVDVLLLHNCDPQEDYSELMRSSGLMDLARRLKAQGKARIIGFSGHTVATALQAVRQGEIDMIMFPINLVGRAIAGKQDLYRACVQENVGLVAMKPFAGGKLLLETSTVAVDDWQTGGRMLAVKHNAAATPVRCLAYVLEQPGVATVVPGCKDVAEVEAAQAFWEANETEKDYRTALDGLEYVSGECVYCNHCLPCPSLIDIGQTIRLMELSRREGLKVEIRAAYAALEHHASECIECGQCVERCPFGAHTVDLVLRAAKVFGV